MNVFYYSIYGPLFKEYIELKRSLGYKYTNIEYAFRKFDRFVLQSEESHLGLSRQLCDQWCIKLPKESEKSWYNRIQIIREFSSFLRTKNYSSFLPKLPRIKNPSTPYIYSKEEITSLFKHCDQLKAKSSCYNSIVLILPCLVRLLYGAGLRLGEALALRCSDVNVVEHYIILRISKSGKERIVPTSESLNQVCIDYLKCRKHFPLRKKMDLFFVHPDGSHCTNR